MAAVPKPDDVSLTVDQENKLREAIAQEQPLVGPLEPLSVLRPQYEGNVKGGFVKGVDDLGRRYKSMRRIRGDGNCFYRAFLFRLLERAVAGFKAGDERVLEEVASLKTKIKDSKGMLLSLGYQEIAIECFWESMVQALDGIVNKTQGQLEKDFSEARALLLADDCMAEYLVWYCRLLTSMHLKLNAPMYEPFITSGDDVAGFCQKEVEPMGMECEQLQIMALCQYLETPVLIEYLDGQDFGEHLNHIVVPEGKDGAQQPIQLLYRPGHYDILIPAHQ
ncbi:unnamed protein product [Chrysoparadoxa australica]